MHRPSSTLLLACVVWAATATAQCELLTPCSACTQVLSCGWCASTQTCVSGHAEGPTQGTCASYTFDVCPNCDAWNYNCGYCLDQAMCGYCPTATGDNLCVEGNASFAFRANIRQQCTSWAFGPGATCPTPAPPTPAPAPNCATRSGPGNCNTCLQTTGCGWCGASQECVPGDTFGPNSGSCATWFGSQCPTCSNAGASCQSCLQSFGCGYCASAVGSQMCFEGNASNPYRGRCNNWFFAPATCPVPPETLSPATTCSNAYNCAYCLEQYGCGWCASTQTCMQGTSSPTSGTCANWYAQGSNCPAACNGGTCESCRLTSNCGWCTPSPSSVGSVTGCVVGNGTAPASGQCLGNWTEFPGTCPRCSSFTTCGACAGATGLCGWCATTNQCVMGNNWGPTGNSGPCSNYVWYSNNCPVTVEGNAAAADRHHHATKRTPTKPDQQLRHKSG